MRRFIVPACLAAMMLAPLSADAAGAGRAREVTVPSGSLLRLKLETPVASDSSRIEQPVRARLAQSLVVDGRRALPAGSLVLGEVVDAQRSGRVKGRGRLAVRFHTLIHDNERYAIRTRTWARQAPGTKKKDALTIGGTTAGGAIVGALIGGKKGAGIGAATGGGAGTAVVLSTRGKEVRLGRGAILLVRLAAPLTIDRG